ncbi:MAG: hypothetical protein MRECE_6c037 [Mycoplasmataceae bacterium CE_OT135]|nr:MAG: hypothetical protein MRECE_17c013 [Mycoplasmataceae bacterium CE_OT135]KLL03933.1 MAG: hypothetical protein MRECE_6c037 [Mycoplasmataceae bacterium CE_OT135]
MGVHLLPWLHNGFLVKNKIYLDWAFLIFNKPNYQK